jgi:3-isopropylmalate dehydrogenase
MAQAAHGSAPDIAGQDRANPIAMILSTAMLFEWLGARHHDEALRQVATSIERAVVDTVAQGISTHDMGGTAGCREFAEAVATALKQS